MKNMREDDLIRYAQTGNRDAFAALLDRHYAFMFKIAWQWCGRREDAEDIAQDAAIKLAENIRAFRFESAFTTWLYRLTINMAKDHFKAKNRRDAREAPLFDDAVHVSAAASPEQALAGKDLLRAVAALPDDLRETVILVCWHGMTHKAAGDMLDCAEGTISWRVSEARKKIAETLGPEMGEKRHG